MNGQAETTMKMAGIPIHRAQYPVQALLAFYSADGAMVPLEDDVMKRHVAIFRAGEIVARLPLFALSDHLRDALTKPCPAFTAPARLAVADQ